jgi:carbon monoxide dehydrogenase subunit G
VEMSGEQLIPLPQADVWRGLNDPEVLKASIPGCDSIEKLGETDYKLVVTAAIGPVKAKFTGKLALSNINAPNSYSLNFEGSGGAAGFSKGSAQVALSPEGRSTRLRYSTKASVGGKLAQVGSRLIDGVAAKLAEDFFTRFNETLAPTAAEAAPVEQAAKPVGLNPIWIVAGIIAAMLIASWLIGAPRYIS